MRGYVPNGKGSGNWASSGRPAHTVLTEAQVTIIRELRLEVSANLLARRFNCSKATIHRVWRNQRRLVNQDQHGATT